MKLVCERTSNYDESIKPCEEAERLPFTRVDRRTVDNPSKNRYLTDWYNSGTNHRVENGMITRDIPDERWYVTLNSLEDLQAFIAKHGGTSYGQVVLQIRNDGTAPYLTLEIYDTYRE
jgi:hypothetical protein